MSVMKEQIAGAARSLWMERMGASDDLQEKLMRAFGQSIVYSEAMNKLGLYFTGMTPSGFAILCQIRWRTAEAAQYLFMVHGTEPGFLIGARPAQIDDVYATVRAATKRDSSVADAAEWLYHNRGSRAQTLAYKAGHVIKQMCEQCKAADARAAAADQDKKYSLSDLRRAYDMGFGNSGEGWNQEIHPDYLDKENYQAERHEALREFN